MLIVTVITERPLTLFLWNVSILINAVVYIGAWFHFARHQP